MNIRFFSFSLFFLSLIAFLFSCNSPYTYKKTGYFHIDFPEKKYQPFNEPGYPYTFEYPVYSTVSKDTSFFDARPENEWWLNIDIPRFGGRIYISYKEVQKNNFDSLVNDGFKMAYKQHTDVSTGINDSLVRTPNGVEGIYFSLSGNTATANQFFLTDSTRHFLRGALYFNASPNEDSLGIVNDFLKKDLLHLINTLKWK
ncbi:gliding motility lipoprotein GldD [Terrimonas alba]|uniref:gliding motility lipoprotein GldD n=1 Tax=Terrimonas alba TaxID=3349636 RepID=UPI0035F36092